MEGFCTKEEGCSVQHYKERLSCINIVQFHCKHNSWFFNNSRAKIFEDSKGILKNNFKKMFFILLIHIIDNIM